MTDMLIVCSTEFEISDFLSEQCGRISPFLFQLNDNQSVKILISGIGIANCTLRLTQFFSGDIPKKAINTGLCGSFSPDLPPGTGVRIQNDCFAELGIELKDHSISCFENVITNSEMLSSLNMYVKPDSEISTANSLPTGNGITVSTCTGTQTRADFLKKTFQADTESMEGAAFFLCCNEFHVPCAQIRVVSNLIPGREAERWNVSLAKKNIGALLKKITV